MIALADCNNFYASCERVFKPIIGDKPVVVLSNNDGCVIARSNEAKNLGIKMGTPAFKYKNIFNKHDVYIFSTNFALYGDFSNRVMSILATSVPMIEVYSIDEAFMDYSGFKKPIDYAKIIRCKVKKWAGIPISIGIARTKTLAKVANRIAKEESKNGVYYLNCPYEIKKYLKQLPISKLWGVGRQYKNKLQLHGIYTAYDLMQKSDVWIQKNMSILGLKMVKELRGIPCISLETKWKIKKTIRVSRTFGSEIDNFKELSQAISTYATMCGMKLRAEDGYAKSLTIFIITNIFKTSGRINYSGIKHVKFEFPTNNSLEIISLAVSALKSIYRPNCLYKRGGVIISDIISSKYQQLNMFNNIENTDRLNSLMKAIDLINDSYGRMKIRFAINGFNANWELEKEYLSPSYTTQISDLVQVKT